MTKDARTIAEEFRGVLATGTDLEIISRIQQALESYGKEQYEKGVVKAAEIVPRRVLNPLGAMVRDEILALLPKEEERKK